MENNRHYDVIIIGAGASGLMCAREAGQRGRRVLVIDHADQAGKKILISGGGRCNFTNSEVSAAHYLSGNQHFCKSALAQFDQHEFIAMMKAYKIKFHERNLWRQFCDDSAKQIVAMLREECEKNNVDFKLNTKVLEVSNAE